MLKVHDGRKTNEIRLHEVEQGGFFIWETYVCRRINEMGSFDGTLALDDPDDLPIMLMTTGELYALSRDRWVEPIPDKQMYLEIED